MIESALDASRRDLQKHVDLAKGFALSCKDVRDATKQKRYNTIRSFYRGNDCELPRSEIKFTQVEETDIDLVQEEAFDFINNVRKAVNQSNCSVIERAIVLIQFQSGMDDSTLARVFNCAAYYQLVQHFKTDNFRNWDSSECSGSSLLETSKNKQEILYFPR